MTALFSSSAGNCPTILAIYGFCKNSRMRKKNRHPILNLGLLHVLYMHICLKTFKVGK